jgi:Mor family transcriptional regulator
MNFPAVPQQPHYPEMLHQMAQLIANQMVLAGVDAQRAIEGALSVTEQVRKDFGGIQFYLSKGAQYELTLRESAIYKKFNGTNYTDLAREYHCTERWIRMLVERGRAIDIAQRQQGLPGL